MLAAYEAQRAAEQTLPARPSTPPPSAPSAPAATFEELLQREFVQLADAISPAKPFVSQSEPLTRAQRRAVEAEDRCEARTIEREQRARDAAAARTAPKPYSKLRVSRSERANERHLARLRARQAEYAEAHGLDPEQWKPEPIPRRTFVMTRDIEYSELGCRIWLKRFRGRFPHAVAEIERAALAPIGDGSTAYDYRHPRARKIVAMGLGLLDMSRRAPSEYGTPALPKRRGRWCHYVTGITIGALQMLVADADGQVPSRSAVVGWHQCRKDDAFRRPLGALIDGQVGYIPALRLAGFCYSKPQRTERGDRLLANEKGYESGRPPTRFWIVGRPVDLDNVTRAQEVLDAEARGWRELQPARATRRQRREGSDRAWGVPTGPPPDG